MGLHCALTWRCQDKAQCWTSGSTATGCPPSRGRNGAQGPTAGGPGTLTWGSLHRYSFLNSAKVRSENWFRLTRSRRTGRGFARWGSGLNVQRARAGAEEAAPTLEAVVAGVVLLDPPLVAEKDAQPAGVLVGAVAPVVLREQSASAAAGEPRGARPDPPHHGALPAASRP